MTTPIHELRIDAHGTTQGTAIAYALRLLANMAESADERGHVVGAFNGNASGYIRPVKKEDAQ
jgi:hypothetical protein